MYRVGFSWDEWLPNKRSVLTLPCLFCQLDLPPAEVVVAVVLDAEVAEAVRVDVHALAGVRQVVIVFGANQKRQPDQEGHPRRGKFVGCCRTRQQWQRNIISREAVNEEEKIDRGRHKAQGKEKGIYKATEAKEGVCL